MAEEGEFKLGDIVTRRGDDVHVVIVPDEGWGSIEVVCVVAPADGWIARGETEHNLSRRYTLVERCRRD